MLFKDIDIGGYFSDYLDYPDGTIGYHLFKKTSKDTGTIVDVNEKEGMHVLYGDMTALRIYVDVQTGIDCVYGGVTL